MMRRLGLAAVALLLGACSLPGMAKKTSRTPAREMVRSDEASGLQTAMRRQAEISNRLAGERADATLDVREKSLLRTLRFLAGKESLTRGATPPLPAGVAIRVLRQSKVRMRVEAPEEDDGVAGIVELHDAATERLQVVSRRVAEQVATKAEHAEAEKLSRQAPKLADLRFQVAMLAAVTSQTTQSVVGDDLSAMLATSGMIRTWRAYDMTWTAEDYDLVRRHLVRLRRSEAIAATALALAATVQAAVNDGGDPDAVDAAAKRASELFPVAPVVTDGEVRAYVAGVDDGARQAKRRYEALARRTMGDRSYERLFKSELDRVFADAERAVEEKSKTLDDAAESPSSGPLPSDRPLARSLEGVAALRRGDARGAIAAAIDLMWVPNFKSAFGLAERAFVRQ